MFSIKRITYQDALWQDLDLVFSLDIQLKFVNWHHWAPFWQNLKPTSSSVTTRDQKIYPKATHLKEIPQQQQQLFGTAAHEHSPTQGAAGTAHIPAPELQAAAGVWLCTPKSRKGLCTPQTPTATATRWSPALSGQQELGSAVVLLPAPETAPDWNSWTVLPTQLYTKQFKVRWRVKGFSKNQSLLIK